MREKKLSVYMELIEFKAKMASILPFLLGIMYCEYNYSTVRPLDSIILIVAMLFFNMAVDMLDNYCDYKNASLEHDYKQKTNIIGREGLNPKKVLNYTIIFVVIASILGIYLVSKTGYMLLILGIYSFAVGIFYSYGPRPISSLPLGEFFSGTTMGFVIILITIGVNLGGFDELGVESIRNIFLYSVPSVFSIAGLMLTNNLCDIDEDRINNRKTLACVIGQQNSIRLLYMFYAIAFFGVVVNVIVGIAPLSYIVVLFSTIMVYKNTHSIEMNPIKNKSFKFAVYNLGIILSLQVLGMCIGIILKMIF